MRGWAGIFFFMLIHATVTAIRANKIDDRSVLRAFACFANMLQTHLEDLPHMIVRQRIIDVFSVAAVDDEVCLPQRAELMGDCGFCHIQQRRKVANAEFVLVQRPHDLCARAVAKHLKKIRQVI